MPRILLFALLSVLLPACASTPGEIAPATPAPAAGPSVEAAVAARQRGDFVGASLAYEQLARSRSQPVAADYWVSAAEMAVRAGDANRALQLIGEVPANSLDPHQLGRLQLARAESLLLKNQAYEAVKALPANSSHLPTLSARIEELRARALFASGEPPQSAAAAAGLPANQINAGGTALLLPLSGPFASSAEAVRDGFLAAHFRAGTADKLRIYDAGNSDETTLTAYRQALLDGAAFVVGPLRKESVAVMAAQGTPSVPVLALNYLDERQPAPPRFHQFGLAPEDEARTAAEHAVSQGLRRAIALVPQADWGDRALAAFRQRLNELGGQLVEVGRYTPGQRDFSTPVRNLLRAAKDFDARAKLPPGAPPPVLRRQDVDFLFVVARPLEGRLIGPMLRFYFASDLPTYATALIYDGRPTPDVGGIRFCDMPWMLSSDAYAAERIEAAELAAQKRQPRLFAFGYDAHLLSATLRRGTVGPLSRVPGMTGTLLFGPSAINRGLQCAEIRSEGLQLLGTLPIASP